MEFTSSHVAQLKFNPVRSKKVSGNLKRNEICKFLHQKQVILTVMGNSTETHTIFDRLPNMTGKYES